jgi:hypothetical protein
MKRFFVYYLAILCYGEPQAQAQPSQQLLDAIKQVESGGDCDAIGDGGKAIGPYQIHRSYWSDACAYDPTLASRPYYACFEEAYARRVVVAYLTRYGKGKNAEQLARIHNGGPSGHRKAATKSYWNKIEDAMENKR